MIISCLKKVSKKQEIKICQIFNYSPTLDEKNTKNPIKSSKDDSKNIASDTDKQDNPHLKLKQRATNSTKTSLDAALSASKNINENIRSNLEKVKESPSYRDLQEKLSHLEKTVKVKQNNIKANSPRVFLKLKHGFLGGFEQIVGRIRIGTQYGKSSVDLLSELAKLKELGIISDEEFASKKKEILDRI